MTNIVKDISIFSTEDINKITSGRKKVLVLQKPARVWKKLLRILISDKS